ncbi:uncharacterized protein LOC108845359 [Raphanus sativus]|uniref:Uncharacterized protein LOC108845359 n=1 Tax=Raphanus sativus TaxID=3726 RepID=A0A6J0MNL4_RAPSA|nr:uncharacterized protein LOC108845359 [Raphanus sativus]
MNLELIKEPSAQEIRAALFDIHPDKAPGPDGFSASFFHENWEVIGASVVKEIQGFFVTGCIPSSLNTTHVRLIPKHTGAKSIVEYRPIALCNVFYKIVSKLLSKRLQPLLSCIISENQSAFIPGRAISDNVLLTHETLNYLKTSNAEKNCFMAVKTDMSKAYDRVEWEFINLVFKKLGFHDKFTHMILQCITTVTYSFLINDEVYGNVKPYRGIRQGDPLSPYIFILCGEVLSGLCREAERTGELQGVRVARGSPRVSHLLFADDTMFFCQSNEASCSTLMRILSDYEGASGQKINSHKSSITFSKKTPQDRREAAKRILKIQKEGGNGKYLGLPEHFGRRKKDLFTAIVDRIRQIATHLSSRRLSKAGKMTMLKAVLQAIPTYSMSCFLLPASLCKRIQSALTRFWWDTDDQIRKMSWIAWTKLTDHKALGGLGFREIQGFNQALLSKISWRILTKPDCLLARVLTGKYCRNKSFLEATAPQSCSHGWRGILHGRDLLKANLEKIIGNGRSTKVWQESWVSLTQKTIPYGPFTEDSGDLRVSDLLTDDMRWNIKRVEEILPELSSLILSLQPSQSGAEDSYVWYPTSNGVYTVKSGYNSLRGDKMSLPTTTLPGTNREELDWIRDVWRGEYSPNIKTFLWSLTQKAIPIGEHLQRRGVRLEAKCIRCGELETEAHLFFECEFAQRVWSYIETSPGLDLNNQTSITAALIASRKAVCLPPLGVSTNIIPWILWALWTARNALIFEQKTYSAAETATKGIKLAREWIQAQPSKDSNEGLQASRAKPPGIEHRHPSSTATTICKTDAAWEKGTNTAWLAWIITDATRGLEVRDGQTHLNVTTPLAAEALAMRAAIKAAASLSITHLRMFSDNQTLIRALTDKQLEKEIYGVVKDIEALSSLFVEVSFVFLPRTENGQADALAKSILRNPSFVLGRPTG